MEEDPKFSIAKANDLLVDINNDKFEDLIKVPGIGLKTAQKIIEERPLKNVNALKSMGAILRRAMPFIEIDKMHQTRLTKWIN